MRSVKSSDSPTPTPPLNKLSFTVDNNEIPMEFYTVSAVTLLSNKDFSKLGSHVDRNHTESNCDFDKLHWQHY